MRTKIAIITTDYLEQFVQNIFEKINQDLAIETKIFIYHSYRDIETLYETIPEEYEGILTSGIFPAAIVQKCFPETKRCNGYFNTDDASLCRLFLERFVEDKKVDLSRVYGDFVEIFGVDLKDYLTKEQGSSYTEMIEPKVLRMSVEDIYLLEEKQLEKHMDLHREQKVDFSVTRFSSIVPSLQEQRYKVYFPFPSREFVRDAAIKLNQDIHIRHMESERPVAINVSIRPESLDTRMNSFQQCSNALEQALINFQNSSFMDYIIQRTNTGFEILTNKKKLSSYTDDFTVCRLSRALAAELSFGVCVGYGIGMDMYQARNNAIHAEREASLKQKGSFLINEGGTLIGPLGEAEMLTVETSFKETEIVAADKSGLSPLTVNRVFSAFAALPEGQLTADDLANKLSITKRSANRFLSALCNVDVIEIKTQKRSTSRGRPERVYVLK